MIPYVQDPNTVKLLIEGPKSLAQSWHLQALKNKYKRIFHIDE